MKLKVVTPIFGGGAISREIDEVDFIRVPSIRGHLRFWWRALYGHQCQSSEELAEKEHAIWGGAGDGEDGRSQAEVSVKINIRGEVKKEIKDDYFRKVSYALWVAREPLAGIREPGTTFTLNIRHLKSYEHEIRNAVRAWILFGGYGSRTKRGLGSLTVEGEQRREWLPGNNVNSLRGELRRLFEKDIFAFEPNRQRNPNDLPLLASASLIYRKF